VAWHADDALDAYSGDALFESGLVFCGSFPINFSQNQMLCNPAVDGIVK
jgi:hypothetical protein